MLSPKTGACRAFGREERLEDSFQVGGLNARLAVSIKTGSLELQRFTSLLKSFKRIEHTVGPTVLKPRVGQTWPYPLISCIPRDGATSIIDNLYGAVQSGNLHPLGHLLNGLDQVRFGNTTTGAVVA